MDCAEIHGDYSEGKPGNCIVLSLLEDATARSVIRGQIYPPILQVRDEVLPQSPIGTAIVKDFRQHYPEAVDIMRHDPDLLSEVISFLSAAVPLARALSGDVVIEPLTGVGYTPSSYTAERVRPGTLDWFSRLLDRFRDAAGEDLSKSIERYQRFLPELENLTPRETLTALHDPRLMEIIGAGRVDDR
jgi:hypothetical protein